MAWVHGNAEHDGRERHGWLVGHFIDKPPRGTDAVEIKWCAHTADDSRREWSVGDRCTTLTVLVGGGPFRVYLGDEAVTLYRPGDYVMWDPGTGHAWEVIAESTVMTVRWPSRP